MTDTPRPPAGPPRNRPAAPDDRLKAALKANMARRKAQAQARAQSGLENRSENRSGPAAARQQETD